MTYPTSADICRANGWTVGDLLEGEDKVCRDRIRLTAIGEEIVIACWQFEDLPESPERITRLDFHEWRKVGEV